MPGAPLSRAWRRGRVLQAVVDHVQVAHGVRAQGAELAVGERAADPSECSDTRSPGPASCRRARAGPSRWRARPGSAAARPSTAAGSPPRPSRRGFRSPCPPDPAPVQHHQRAGLVVVVEQARPRVHAEDVEVVVRHATGQHPRPGTGHATGPRGGRPGPPGTSPPRPAAFLADLVALVEGLALHATLILS